MECARQLQHVAAAQRANNVRASNYAARCGFAPTMLQPNEVHVERADGAASLVLSFDQALQRVRDGTEAARARAPQQTLDASFTRDKFVFIPSDIIFLEAGVIEDEDNPGGFVDATEPWWALQVTQPFERARMRPGCIIRGFWLNRVARCSAGRWVLLGGAEVRQRYGTVLKAAGGRPVIVSSSELETGWSSANKLIYTLPAELIEQLDRLAAEAAGEPSEGECSDSGAPDDPEGEAGGAEEAAGGARRRRRVAVTTATGARMLHGHRDATGTRSARSGMQRGRHSLQRLRGDAMPAVPRSAPRRRRGAWRCRSSCKAGLQEWILRPQPGHAVRRDQLTASLRVTTRVVGVRMAAQRHGRRPCFGNTSGVECYLSWCTHA